MRSKATAFSTLISLPSVSLALSLIAVSAPQPSFSQGNAVKFISATTVPNPSNVPQGAYDAVAGNFNGDSRVDILFSGATTAFSPQSTFATIAFNQGGGKFNTMKAPGTLGFQADFADAIDVAADVNEDGISDAIAYRFGQSISITFGSADGTFSGGGVNIPIAALSLVAADFDGNGSMDLAAVTEENTLLVMLNDGHGNFHTAFTYTIPTAPAGAKLTLAVGDINGDTLPDVALVSGKGTTGGTVTPYLSTHGGALIRGTTYSMPTATGFVNAAMGDINKDGHADVAVPTGSGIEIMLGSSSGALTAGPTITVAGASSLVVTDFNKDGVMDLAVAGTQPLPIPSNPQASPLSPSYVNVYLNKGNGTFNDASAYSTGNGAVSLIAGDFFGAGNMDLATEGSGSGNLFLLQNQGNGFFQAARGTYSTAATGVVTGDFNRDGKKDVAVVNTPSCKAPCNGSVTVFPGSGSNFFDPGKTYAIGMRGAAIATGDLNGDGFTDLVVVDATPGDNADTTVLLGKSDGTFQRAKNYKMNSLSNDVALMDVNKDGKLDLITSGGVGLGKGDGTFNALKPLPGFAFDPTMHFAVGDVNGDGKLDVVAVMSTDDCRATAQTLVGDGTGNFTPGQVIFDDFSQPITSITLAKVRTGGPLDALYSFAGSCFEQVARNNSGVAMWSNDGHGTFGDSTPILTGGWFEPYIWGPVIVADFNGDGKPDVGAGGQGYFVVARGNGNDTFAAQQVFVSDEDGENLFNSTSGITTFVPGSAAAADFTGDGRVDVVTTSALGIARLYNTTPH